MRKFSDILATAELHKGGAKQVAKLLPRALSAKQLKQISDDRYLSAMSLRVFQAGLKHQMVLDKWPNFELVFNGFDIWQCAMLSDEAIEKLMSDARIIRHLRKVQSIRANAQLVLNVREQHTSFAEFIADWPSENIVELWLYLKKHGAQLGGQSGARFLRSIGKDTFLLSDDVVNVLVAEKVVSKVPSSKRDLLAVQKAFNLWTQESGRPLCEISRILSFNSF